MSFIQPALRSSSLNLCRTIVQQQPARALNANRAQICRIARKAGEYCRQYPVKIVYQDGSSITARFEVPREIIKFPLKLEDCYTEAEKKAWTGRRRPKEVLEIKKDETDVSFNQSQYLKNMKNMKVAGPSKKRTSGR